MKLDVRTMVVFVAAAMVLFSCADVPKALDPERYSRWISDPDHGLSKHRKIGGFDISARYLPGPFLAYNEYTGSSSESYDSLLNSYKCSLSFQVQFQADDKTAGRGNLMYYGIDSPEAFSERMRHLSFRIQEFLSLTAGDTEYEPVLSNFEGYDPLGNKLSFHVVFAIPDFNCGNVKPTFDDVTLTFVDPYWGTGTVNFVFDKDAIVHLPGLEI